MPPRQTRINRRSSLSSSPSSSLSPRSQQAIRPRFPRSPSRISTSSMRHLTRQARTSPFPVVSRVPFLKTVNIKGSSRKKDPKIRLKPPVHRTYRDRKTRQMLEAGLKMLDKSKIPTGCYLTSTTRIIYRTSQLTIQASILKGCHLLKRPSMLHP